jgi:hypothetical protein
LGLLGLSVLSFIGAVGAVVYLATEGTYLALALVLFGSFLMIASAIVRERHHQFPNSPERQDVILEDEEAQVGV